MKRAIFLDRDGTINEDVGYPKSFAEIHILPSSFEAVRKINQAGFLAVIITNQSGIGRGLLTEEELRDIHLKMSQVFELQGAHFDAIYYCPHYTESPFPEYKKDCFCRKPFQGMALQAATELGVDLKRSYMIGDKVEDILFGFNIEATPILVLTGYGRDSLKSLITEGLSPAFAAQDLLAAVEWILERERKIFL